MTINAFLKDPVLLLAGVVLIATIGILVWALKMLQNQDEVSEEVPYEETEQTREEKKDDQQGILEARVHEVLSQLNIISQRLDEIERVIKENQELEKTIPGLQSATNTAIEKLTKDLNAKFESGAGAPTGPKSEDMERLETKLDSIRKLLVLLTESGNPNE
jgi:myosin heavy subunit